MPKIDVIWAFISVGEDPEDEGIIGWKMGDTWMPLVGADEKRIDSLRPYAEATACATKKPVVLAKFTNREDTEIIKCGSTVSFLKNWHHHKYTTIEDDIAADYRDKKLSLSEISAKYRIPSDATVIKILDRKGVKRRSISEGLSLRRKKKWLRRVRWLHRANGTIPREPGEKV